MRSMIRATPKRGCSFLCKKTKKQEAALSLLPSTLPTNKQTKKGKVGFFLRQLNDSPKKSCFPEKFFSE